MFCFGSLKACNYMCNAKLLVLYYMLLASTCDFARRLTIFFMSTAKLNSSIYVTHYMSYYIPDLDSITYCRQTENRATVYEPGLDMRK